MSHAVRALVPFCFALLCACVGDPVGDPCVPESIPPDGFVAEETYLETSSPQCESRLCVVRGLEGDPTPGCAGERCAPEAEVREHVYCTARILKAGRRRIYGTAECHNRAGRLFTHHTVTYVQPD